MVTSDLQDSLQNIAWRSLADTYRTVYFYVNSDLRKYGLTPPQYAVMRIIGTSNDGRVKMKDIGKEMIVTFANVTTIVDNLGKRGIVRRIRSSEDRRVIYVALTSKGGELFRKIRTSHRQEITDLMHSLSKSELQELLDLTKKIKASVPSPKLR